MREVVLVLVLALALVLELELTAVRWKAPPRQSPAPATTARCWSSWVTLGSRTPLKSLDGPISWERPGSAPDSPWHPSAQVFLSGTLGLDRGSLLFLLRRVIFPQPLMVSAHEGVFVGVGMLLGVGEGGGVAQEIPL